jgi:hypothetical protein
MSAVAATRTLPIDYETKAQRLADVCAFKRCARLIPQVRIITVEKEKKSQSLDPECAAFYCDAMRLLEANGVPFLLGGAYALCVYTGLARHTKDVDLFIQRTDLDRALGLFEKNGYLAEKTFPHWLAKVYRGDNFVDLIFAAGNGVAVVDGSWFARSRQSEFLGRRVKVMAPEEIIWMKAFIQERERYDGADIAHLIRSCAEALDWRHLRERFGADWRVLFSFLVLFGYIYPSERQRVPADLWHEFSGLLLREQETPCSDRICRGTFLSRAQFLPDVSELGYRDARLEPRTTMTEKDVNHWTAAIEENHRTHVTKSCG